MTLQPWLVPVLLLLLACVVLVPVAGAQNRNPGFGLQLNQWQQQLDDAKASLDNDFEQTSANTVGNRLKKVIKEAEKARSVAQKRLESAQKQLDKLGKPPKEDEPSEEPDISRLRQELDQRVGESKAHSTRAELIISSANDLLGSIASWRQARVRAQILQRSPPPVSLPVWYEAGKAGLAFAKSALTSPMAWWQARQQKNKPNLGLLWLLLLPVTGLLVGWPVRHFIMSHFGRDPNEMDPTYARRILKASVDGLANAIIPVVIILLVTVVLAWQGVLTGLFAYLVYAIAAAIAAFIIVFGLARSALSPQLVQWRVVPVEPAYTRDLLRAIGAVVALLAAATVLLATAWTSQHLTPDLEAVFFLIQSIVTALALIWLLTPKYWASSIVASQQRGTAEEHAEELGGEEGSEEPAADTEQVSPPRWIRVVRALRWLVLLTPFMALAGYGRLSFHLQSRLVVTGALVGVTLLLRLALREALEHVLIGRQRRQYRRKAQRSSDDQDTGLRIMNFWAGLWIDVLLLIPLVYVLLLVYGVPWTTLRLWTQWLLQGVNVGSINIAPSNILIALVVLALGLFAISMIRRWTTNRLLPNTRLDIGVRNSISSGTSYVGVAIAIVLAIAALGIDFSNLALVAGALSLGIGFGLQNLVQNFAAGIMLLIERPIKVGDWVQLGTEHGTVKRISVRSTEVETFNRTTIFVPNSELIANKVTNWTHGSRMVRLIVYVRAAYGSDPALVEEVLLRCARKQRHVLRFPEFYVWFRGFADGVLNFELRVYLDNGDNWVIVDSGLYFAIEKAFREEGIVIPFPQRDLHIRSNVESVGPGTDAVLETESERQQRAPSRQSASSPPTPGGPEADGGDY